MQKPAHQERILQLSNRGGWDAQQQKIPGLRCGSGHWRWD